MKKIILICLVALSSSACNEDPKSLLKIINKKQLVVDHNLYSNIVQKKSIASYVDGTYFVDTQIWVGEKEHITNRISLEYYELEKCSVDDLDITLKKEYLKAKKAKDKIDLFLKQANLIK